MRYEIDELELNLLVMNTVLAAIAVGTLVMSAFTLAPEALSPTSSAVWSGAGLFAIMVVCYPVARVHLRIRRGRRLSALRFALWSVVGSAVGAVLSYVL